MFFNKSNLLNSIGYGAHSINLTFFKKTNVNNSTLHNLPSYKNFFTQKNTLKKKFLLPVVQFNKLNQINKLTKLGFNFTNIKFFKYKFPLDSNVKNINLNYNFLFKLVLNQVLVVKSIHTYLIINLIYQKNIINIQ